MDDRIGLVFSWDPRNRAWVKERGPEEAAPPPALPRDVGAVQTYFLDPQTGRWHASILGLRARQISFDLGTAHRSPFIQGLDIAEAPVKRYGAAVEDEKRGSKAPLVAGIVLLISVAGGGAFAAQTMLGGAPLTTPSAQPSTTVAASAPAASTAPTAAVSVAPTPAATVAAATPATTPVPTPPPTTAPQRTAPPPPPPQGIVVVTYTTTFSNGTRVTYTGPNGVIQNTALDMSFSAIDAKGNVVYEAINVFIGAVTSGQSITVTAGPNGKYFGSVKVTQPKGDQLLSISLGNRGETRVIGTITVR